jgi:carbamoyltransferase
MTTTILGISAFYHDSAAALIRDGEIVAAAQEERFTRRKYDARFPSNAIAYCLHEGGIDATQLDYVAFYEQPWVKFERLLETYLAFVPRGFQSFRQALPLWARQKLHLPREIKAGLEGKFSLNMAMMARYTAWHLPLRSMIGLSRLSCQHGWRKPKPF